MFLCLVISRVKLIRKDKEKFRSARKIRLVENGLYSVPQAPNLKSLLFYGNSVAVMS